MRKALHLSLAITFVVLTPIWLPFVLVAVAIDRWQFRRAAESFSCPGCGGRVGVAGIRLADVACRVEVRALAAAHPGLRLRLDQRLHAICPTCGARYGFDRSARSFRTVAGDAVELRGSGDAGEPQNV